MRIVTFTSVLSVLLRFRRTGEDGNCPFPSSSLMTWQTPRAILFSVFASFTASMIRVKGFLVVFLTFLGVKRGLQQMGMQSSSPSSTDGNQSGNNSTFAFSTSIHEQKYSSTPVLKEVSD